MPWNVEPSIRPLLRTEGIFVGEWRCPGEARAWATEVTSSIELELPVSGMHLRAFRGQRWIVDPSRILAHRAGEEYLMASPSGRPQRSTILRLKEDVLEELGPCPHSASFPIPASLALLHGRLLTCPDAFEFEESALALVAQILRHARGHIGPDRISGTLPAVTRRLAARLEEVLALRYSERWTLSELARACGTTAFHSSRVFRAVTGVTLHRRLNQLRLRAGLYQLKAMEGDLASLALSLGYSSHSHFTFAFRKEYGRSPAAWLQEVR